MSKQANIEVRHVDQGEERYEVASPVGIEQLVAGDDRNAAVTQWLKQYSQVKR